MGAENKTKYLLIRVDLEQALAQLLELSHRHRRRRQLLFHGLHRTAHGRQASQRHLRGRTKPILHGVENMYFLGVMFCPPYCIALMCKLYELHRLLLLRAHGSIALAGRASLGPFP